MSISKPMRIALLTHSTNPRGGVVHVTHLGEALADLGHRVVVHAPDPYGKGFSRPLRCSFASVPASAVSEPLESLVRRRIGEYINFFQSDNAESFDLYHAHDGICGCALAALAERGCINGFVRTVHHLDKFTDPYLIQRQDESITSANKLLCVSRLWGAELLRHYGIHSEQVTNGVDLERFTSVIGARDQEVCAQLGIRKGAPVFLNIGGVETRKNTVRLLEAFIRVIRERPGAQLIIAGGASLLDHSSYRKSFDSILHQSGLVIGRDILLTGPLPDDHIPVLMRSADALVFPSIVEGFGLVVLEAMACGTPVVVSRIEPFTEYLCEKDCVWADPFDVNSIAAAMLQACEPKLAMALRSRGFEMASRFPWSRSARTHEIIYTRLIEELRDAGNAISSSMA